MALKTALEAKSWKSPELLREMIFRLQPDDAEAAGEIFKLMPESRIKRQVCQWLANRGAWLHSEG